MLAPKRCHFREKTGEINVANVIKETRYIDEATGEIRGGKIQHIAAAFHEERGYLFWARKSFAKSFVDVPFPKQMTHSEIGKLAILAKHIWSGTNMLGYRGSGGAKPYTVVQLGRCIGLGERKAKSFVNKMIRLGVMARVIVKAEGRQETQLYINPVYFFSSNRIPLNLYLIFRWQLDAVLPDWVKQEFAGQEKGQNVGSD